MKKWNIAIIFVAMFFLMGVTNSMQLAVSCLGGKANVRVIGASGSITIRVWEQKTGALYYIGQEEVHEFDFQINPGEYRISIVDSSGVEIDGVFATDDIGVDVGDGTTEAEEEKGAEWLVEPDMPWSREQEFKMEFVVGWHDFVLEDAQNGRRNFSMDVPTVYNDRRDRVLVPVRFFSEALGYEVSYDWQSGGVTIENAQDKIQLQAGSDMLLKNGEAVQMDTQVVQQNWRTYLPLRYVGEAFGFDVEWDGVLEKATLLTNTITLPEEGSILL